MDIFVYGPYDPTWPSLPRTAFGPPSNAAPGGTITPAGALLTESGDVLLTESGDALLTET